jgi:hypothetical protein
MKTKSNVIILVFSVLISSCTELVQQDLTKGDNNKLVVQGSITNEFKRHEIKLTRSAEYYFNQPALPETGAMVSISDGDTTMYLFDDQNIGVYQTVDSCSGKIGHQYTLTIQTQDGSVYTSADEIRDINPMDSIKYEYIKSEMPFDDKYYYNINIYAKENPKLGNYYQWEVYFDDRHVTDTLRLKIFVDDAMVNGSYISNWTVYRIQEDKLKNDTTELTLQMLSISKEKYEFYSAILFETDYSGGPFSGPPANIPSNISNGALGFFSASEVTESKIKVIKVKKP